MQKIPCVVLDLDKKQEKILNLALNKIVGGWSDEKLTSLIKELTIDPETALLTGFSKDEMDLLMVQHDLIFGGDGLGEGDNEAMAKLFERGERVNIPVERPEVKKTKAIKLGFYAESLEQYEAIREFFKTGRENELDVKKLYEVIKK